ncbi:MAG TPA: glycosyltransferase [Planctomycetes bacterium]|nr:glycosyltransferase [Planctomycetota bacterium]
MNPSLTFLLPFRNAGEHLEEALLSLQAQTLGDWACVLVDDGSEDGGYEIAQRFRKKDGRFRLLRTGGLGIARALQKGLEGIDSPLVARMDADDRAAPERLRLQLEVFREGGDRLAVVDGACRFFRDGGEVPEGMRLYQDWVNGICEEEDFDAAFLLECPVVHPAATIRRSALLAVGGYRDGDFPEDFDLWLRLREKGFAFRKVPSCCVEMRDGLDRATRTDPRYRRGAFVRLAQDYVLRNFALERPFALWGAGRGGKPWLRQLMEAGKPPAFLVDVDPKKLGRKVHGIPVCPPEALREKAPAFCLVAVGAREAGPLIREEIARLRPMWREGRDWWRVVT